MYLPIFTVCFCKTFVKCFECIRQNFKRVDCVLVTLKSSICVKVNKKKGKFPHLMNKERKAVLRCSMNSNGIWFNRFFYKYIYYLLWIVILKICTSEQFDFYAVFFIHVYENHFGYIQNSCQQVRQSLSITHACNCKYNVQYINM